MDTAKKKKKKDNSVLTVLAHYYHHIFPFCFLVRGDFSFESAMFDTTTPPPLKLEAAGFMLRVSSKGAPATGGQSCAHSSDNTLSMVTTSVMLYTK